MFVAMGVGFALFVRPRPGTPRPLVTVHDRGPGVHDLLRGALLQAAAGKGGHRPDLRAASTVPERRLPVFRGLQREGQAHLQLHVRVRTQFQHLLLQLVPPAGAEARDRSGVDHEGVFSVWIGHSSSVLSVVALVLCGTQSRLGHSSSSFAGETLCAAS